MNHLSGALTSNDTKGYAISLTLYMSITISLDCQPLLSQSVPKFFEYLFIERKGIKVSVW